MIIQVHFICHAVKHADKGLHPIFHWRENNAGIVYIQKDRTEDGEARMQKWVLPRQSGKTTRLLEQASTASQDGSYNLIVCHSEREVIRVWKLIQSQKLPLPMPISFQEFLQRQYEGRHIKGFYIDQADYLLQQIAGGVPIKMITMDESE